MSRSPSGSRPLQDDERQLLEHLLATDVPGVEELREQARHVLVTDDSSLPRSLDLQVPAGAAPQARVREPVPINAYSVSDGEDAIDVTLWVTNGFLAAIEVAWYEREPQRLPQPSELLPAKPFLSG